MASKFWTRSHFELLCRRSWKSMKRNVCLVKWRHESPEFSVGEMPDAGHDLLVAKLLRAADGVDDASPFRWTGGSW